LVIVLCSGLAILTAILVWITSGWWCQSEIQRAEEEVRGGQIDSARARLVRLARLGLGGAELDYWLGACEEGKGHVDAALAAWARIPVGSTRFADAALDRARLAIKEGRFALAEDVREHTTFPTRSSSDELS